MGVTTSHPLLRKLDHFNPLPETERHRLVEACQPVRRLAAKEDLIREGDPPQGVNLLLEGFAFRYKLMPDGRRQILGYFVPGDICDLRVFILRRMDHSIAALTPAQVAVIPGDTIMGLTETFPRITRALWWSTLVEEAITRESLVTLGQRSATERLAHLICELYHRLAAVGMVRDGGYDFPVTQAELGDTLGLSSVHVNRTLQELRRQGLITLRDKDLRIHDLPALEELAIFDPTYLHLGREGVGQQDRHGERV
jgi:CRP-like cAMP-binding protein